MNLYLLETKGIENYYVIANDPTQAKEKLESDLAKASYSGRIAAHEVTVITLLAKQTIIIKEKPDFSNGHNLIIVD